MKKALIVSLIAFITFLFVSLMALSVDVYRMQRQKAFNGTYQVHVFSYGWHTGLVVAMADIPKQYRPYFKMLKGHRFVEISWGDAKFYQNRDPQVNWWLAIRAVLLPTKSVMHLVGFDASIEDFYRFSEVQTIFLPKKDFDRMMGFICSFFEPDSVHKFSIIDRGLYGDSWFLKSKATYIFPYTCNVWTARALRKASIPLTPVFYQSARLLMRTLSEFSKQNKKERPKNVRLVQSRVSR
ncbi:MAG: DUF2459 domain-containing protein [Calditrichaeota bacterium]|nr:DUF2459 domain-containing protein [Calditrichota bacterium]